MSKSDKILGAILAVVVILTGGFLFWQNIHFEVSPIPIQHHEIRSPKITTVFLAGDIMLSRNVNSKMLAANNFALPFANIKTETQSANISFANLESPFSSKGPYFGQEEFIFNTDPRAISGLTDAGFDILSTANNHALDQDEAGLNFTYDLLKQNNILPIGTTTDCHQGQILTRNNIKFGFLAYTYGANGNNLGIVVCDANDLQLAATDIANLRLQVDVLLVSMHMGIEYKPHPVQAQIDFAHSAIDAGADFIVGAHPHWIQDVETYRGKYIFYSLGNFVFDQMFSTETREGLTVKITYSDKTLSKIEFNPVIIENFCCPRFANFDEKNSILSKSNLTSPIVVPHN